MGLPKAISELNEMEIGNEVRIELQSGNVIEGGVEAANSHLDPDRNPKQKIDYKILLDRDAAEQYDSVDGLLSLAATRVRNEWDNLDAAVAVDVGGAGNFQYEIIGDVENVTRID